MTKKTRNSIICAVLTVIIITAVSVTLSLTLNKTTITYISDGEIYETEKATKGKQLELPTPPVKDGYDFKGWYLDYGVWDYKFYDNYLIKNDIYGNFNVYAKWDATKLKSYTINYHFNDKIVATQHYYENENITCLDLESHLYGYEIEGWYYDYDTWNEPFVDGTIADKNLDIYAKTIDKTSTEFDFNICGDGYTISNYTGSSASVVIPEKHNYKRILGVDEDTFDSSITSITVPNTITDVTPFLANCVYLQELALYSNIGANVGSLFGAVSYNDNISCIPNSLTTIKYNGAENENINYFDNIKSLTNVCFGNDYLNNERISEFSSTFVFADCDKLNKFEVPVAHNRLKTLDGVLYSADKTVLLRYPNNKTFDIINVSSRTTIFAKYAFSFNMTVDEVIVTSIIRLGDNCFNSSSISSISFLNEVNGPNIGESAFENCLSLKSISFNTSLEIGIDAFEGCVNIDRVNISCINDWCYMRFGIRYSNPLYYAKSLYLNGIQMDEIIIPNDVKRIGSDTFINCDMSSIVLHDNIESIGSGAFEGCSNLTEVTLPSSLEIVDGYMFKGCINLEYVGLPYSVKEIGTSAFRGCSSLNNIDLPANLEVLDGYVFNSSGIENIIIPDGVKVINAGTFADCTNLQYIQLSSSLDSIGNSAFENSGIKSIAIPDNVSVMQYNSFKGCTSLQDIKLSNNLISIGYSAFENSGIKSIAIPNNVSMMQYNSFKGCTSLQDIKLSNNLISIGYSAFENSGIKSIKIPDNVSIIEDYTFGGCTSLQDIKLPANLSIICTSTFENSGIKSIVIPDNVSIIESYAFRGCKYLNSVTFGKNIKDVGLEPFRGCEQLTKVYITSLVDWCNIEFNCEKSNPLYYAHDLYLNNKKINELVITDDVFNINRFAFSGAHIISVVIPESVVNIATDIFCFSTINCIYAEATSKPSGWVDNETDGNWNSGIYVYWYSESEPVGAPDPNSGRWRYVSNTDGVLVPTAWK